MILPQVLDWIGLSKLKATVHRPCLWCGHCCLVGMVALVSWYFRLWNLEAPVVLCLSAVPPPPQSESPRGRQNGNPRLLGSHGLQFGKHSIEKLLHRHITNRYNTTFCVDFNPSHRGFTFSECPIDTKISKFFWFFEG